MAGTSPRRWTLLPVALIALLTSQSFGDELPSTTYESGTDEADPGQLWRCPRCGRVERLWMVTDPQCFGGPEKEHSPANADPVSEDKGPPRDNLHLFE
jgi:hypothetical protein